MSSRRSSDPKGLSATKMRIILSCGLVLILAAMATGFYFSYLYLQDVSQEVSTIQTEAESSDAAVQALVTTEKQLKEYSVVVEKARQIVAESQSYRYQDQVLTDLSEYARRANVPITSFTFQGADSAQTPTQEEGAAPATTTPGQETKTTTVSVQLGPNVNYANLLRFIHLIEENLTRMQISQLSLTRGESPDIVTAQTLNIEVYLR